MVDEDFNVFFFHWQSLNQNTSKLNESIFWSPLSFVRCNNIDWLPLLTSLLLFFFLEFLMLNVNPNHNMMIIIYKSFNSDKLDVMFIFFHLSIHLGMMTVNQCLNRFSSWWSLIVYFDYDDEVDRLSLELFWAIAIAFPVMIFISFPCSNFIFLSFFHIY